MGRRLRSRRRRERSISLCPRCARFPINEESPDGWCAVCRVIVLADDYEAKNTRAADERKREWARLGEESQRYDAARKTRQRLRQRVQPTRPADYSDPWTIADEALKELAQIRPAVRRSSAANAHRFEIIEEAIRRLAWGPDADGEDAA